MWQDTRPSHKNQKIFYAPTVHRIDKGNMNTIPFTIASKNQIPRMKLNKGYEMTCARQLQTSEERD
jgi:hypothetical protein